MTSKKQVDTRELILDAAASNFAARGFGGARMDAIAKDAGVNKATIYYHIGDKKALYREALKRVLGNIADQVAENVRRASFPEDRIRVYIKTIASNIQSAPCFTPMILRELATGGVNFPDEVLGEMKRVIGTLDKILKEACASGSFREADLAGVHMMIVGGINFFTAGTGMFGRVEKINKGNVKTTGEFADSIAAIILEGLKTRG